MWEGLVRAPRGRLSTRKLMMLLTTCLVAVFAQLTILTTPARAVDAYWKDGSIVYAGHTYAQQVSNPDDNLGLIADTPYYLYIEDIPGVTAKKAYVIYFGSNTSPPTATSATYKTYTLANGKFTNPSGEKQLTIEPPQSQTGPSKSNGSSCDVPNGLGWILCSVSRTIANAMDYVYSIISDFLSVQPLQTTQQGPLYKAWDIARNMANLSFIVGFLVVIYAQITGGVLTNYSIKKIMPRIIVTAILINISYWICAVVVDLSNILGYSINDFFISIRQSIGAPLATLTWTDVTEFVLTSGTVAGGTVAGYTALLTASGGSIFSVFYLLLMVMVSVIFAALVALIILAMRQALITVLIITAPLAFVLYLLPNTEKWFSKWREAFAAMMFMFPIFSVIFGGSQLASAVIIQNAKSPAVAILGLAVQVAPLVVTPMIIKFSGSLLGRIAGMVNNSKKGLFDRTKNALKDRADYHAARGREKGAEFQRLNKKSPWYRPTSQAYRHERAKQKREDWKKGFEERTAQAIHADEKYQRGRRESYNPLSDDFKKRQNLDTYKRLTNLSHDETEAHHEQDWEEKVLGSKDLTDRMVRLTETKRRAAQAKEITEDKANVHWEDLTLNDRTIYSRQLDRQRYAKDIKDAQGKWEAILSEAAAGRTDDYQGKFGPITQQVDTAIKGIQAADQSIAVQSSRKERADYVTKTALNTALKDNSSLLKQAAGIDEEGEVKVLANLQKEASALHMQNVEAIKSVFSNDKRYTVDRLKDVYQKGVLADGTKATLAQRHAAIQRIMLETGNNYAAQDVIDFSGMIGVQEKRDANGNAILNASGEPILYDIYGNALSDEEVDNRRDMQQIINDAALKSKLKVDWDTGTDKGNRETGRHLVRDTNGRVYTQFAPSEVAIATEINKGKVDYNRALNSDIDVIDKQAKILSKNDVISTLVDRKAAAQYADTLTKFLKDEQTGMRLEKRARGSYHILLKQLEAIASTGQAAPISSIDTSYVDVSDGSQVEILDFNRISSKPDSTRPTGPVSLS